MALSTINDALGARPDQALIDMLDPIVRNAITWGRRTLPWPGKRRSSTGRPGTCAEREPHRGGPGAGWRTAYADRVMSRSTLGAYGVESGWPPSTRYTTGSSSPPVVVVVLDALPVGDPGDVELQRPARLVG